MRSTALLAVLACGFFVAYYFFLREYLDPRLLYHGNGVRLPSGELIYFPIFQQGSAFLGEFLGRPGGLSEYLGARFSQYYYDPYAGPLVLTVVALLVYLAGDWLIRLGGGAGIRGLRFVPPLLLLIAYNQYTFQLEDGIALIVALTGEVVYVFVSNRVDKSLVRGAVFTALALGVYYAAGGMFLLFAVYCALFELLVRQRYALSGLYLLAAAGLPLLGKYLFDVSFAAAYFRPGGIYPFEKIQAGVYDLDGVSSGEGWSAGYRISGPTERMTLLCLYFFFVCIPIVLVFREWAARMGTAASGSGQAGRVAAWLKPLGAILALSAIGISVAWLTLDRTARIALRTNYLARMERWGEFLEQIDRYPTREYPESVMTDVDRALFETGRLGSEMFSYPQHPDVLFELGKTAAARKGGCEVLLELGRVNEAEHAALEALEMYGERPEILRLLADVYVLKRRPEVARVFLNVLSRDLIHGPWAEDRLRSLDDDPLLSADPKIRHLRSIMPLTDMVTESKELMLLSLLARNRTNRMAFEYLMAYYLLTRQPDKVALHIDRLDDFGPHDTECPAVPQHYAEAVLLYAHNVNRPLEQPPNLKDRTVRGETLRRVQQILQIAFDYQNDEAAMREVLATRFPNSSCRYLLTGKSGGTP